MCVYYFCCKWISGRAASSAFRLAANDCFVREVNIFNHALSWAFLPHFTRALTGNAAFRLQTCGTGYRHVYGNIFEVLWSLECVNLREFLHHRPTGIRWTTKVMKTILRINVLSRLWQSIHLKCFMAFQEKCFSQPTRSVQSVNWNMSKGCFAMTSLTAICESLPRTDFNAGKFNILIRNLLRFCWNRLRQRFNFV